MFLPHADLVIRAWILAIPGIPVNGVGTTLPGSPALFSTDGFVQVEIVGGTPNADVPQYNPVASIYTWAVDINSARPPWGKANQLAEIITGACYGNVDATTPVQRKVSLPDNYYDAEVSVAYAITEPRPMHNDDARYAEFQFDMQFSYVPLIPAVST